MGALNLSPTRRFWDCGVSLLGHLVFSLFSLQAYHPTCHVAFPRRSFVLVEGPLNLKHVLDQPVPQPCRIPLSTPTAFPPTACCPPRLFALSRQPVKPHITAALAAQGGRSSLTELPARLLECCCRCYAGHNTLHHSPSAFTLLNWLYKKGTCQQCASGVSNVHQLSPNMLNAPSGAARLGLRPPAPAPRMGRRLDCWVGVAMAGTAAAAATAGTAS